VWTRLPVELGLIPFKKTFFATRALVNLKIFIGRWRENEFGVLTMK
jgi:hypothetical protein